MTALTKQTEDLIQTRRGEGRKSDMCTYPHARINSLHFSTPPTQLEVAFITAGAITAGYQV